jgi:hypothetical protein
MTGAQAAKGMNRRKQSRHFDVQLLTGGHVKHHLLTAAIVVVAFVFYSIGLVSGALFLFAGGVLFEFCFWVRILSRRSAPNVLSKRTHERPRAA